MSVTATLYAKTVTWNSNTWNATNGGTMAVNYTHSSIVVEDRTGGDQYATAVFANGKSNKVTVELHEFRNVNGLLDAVSDLIVTCGARKADGTETTEQTKFINLTLTGVSGNQPFSNPAGTVLEFVHQSADGSTVPVQVVA